MLGVGGGGAGNSTDAHYHSQATGLRIIGLPWLTTVQHHIHTHKYTHPRTHSTDRLQWRGRRGLSWGGGVVSRCRNVFLDLSDISEGGKRGIWSASPLWPPPSVATSQHSQHGPEYVRGSSNKIYEGGHKTPCMSAKLLIILYFNQFPCEINVSRNFAEKNKSMPH